MRAADFIQESASSIAGTNGNGAVTLAQITGTTPRPRFSHAFPYGALVRYVIEDTTTGKTESGTGSVSGNVLTRTKPRITWDGTTYSNKSPAALAFGSSPAAGAIIVRLAPTSDSTTSNIPSLVSNAASFTSADTVWNQFPISAHYTAWSASGSFSMSSNSEYYTYHKQEVAGVLTGIQFEMVSSAATGSVKMALYEVDINGLPGQKICDFPATPWATSGIKTLTDQTQWSPAEYPYLTPGWYVIGMITDNSAGLYFRAFNNGSAQNQMQTPLGRSTSYASYKNLVVLNGNFTNGLPAVPNFSQGSPALQANCPWFGLRVVP